MTEEQVRKIAREERSSGCAEMIMVLVLAFSIRIVFDKVDDLQKQLVTIKSKVEAMSKFQPSIPVAAEALERLTEGTR